MLKALTLVHSHPRGFNPTSVSLKRSYSVLLTSCEVHWGAYPPQEMDLSGCQDPWFSPIAMGLVILPGWQGDGVEGNTGPQGKIEAGGSYVKALLFTSYQ